MTVGEREGNPQILLDDQDRRTALAYILQRADDLLYDQRRETFGWLVEHEQRWVEQERTRNRQHLLLATRELRAAEFRALLETREKFKHLVERPQSPLAAPRCDGEVFARSQAGENTSLLWHEPEAHARDDIGWQVSDVAAAIGDATGIRLQIAHDRQQRCCFACAVAPQDRDDLALLHVERNALQHMAQAVIGVKVFDRQHQMLAPR